MGLPRRGLSASKGLRTCGLTERTVVSGCNVSDSLMKMSPSVDIDAVLVFTLDWFGCEGGVKCSLEGLGISVVLDGKGILMLKGLKKRR